MLPALIAGLQGVYGLYRGIKATNELNKLASQRIPRYMDAAGPLMQNKALQEQQYRQGLTPATKALMQNQFATGQLAQQRNIQETSGGQMSNALSRLGALNSNNFALGIGAQNEAAQRQGMQGMIGTNRELSGLEQRDVAADKEYRLRKEMAYGTAAQQGFQDVLGALGGYSMMKMNQDEAQKNRDFYSKLYGLDDGTSSDQTGYIPSSGGQGLQTPQIGRLYNNYDINTGKPIGKYYVGSPNLGNLPPSMGGTNLGLMNSLRTPYQFNSSLGYNPYGFNSPLNQ